MPDHSNDRLTDVATLTKAIESVFRKLIRFLVGRISLVKLQEMISYIYVEETEKKLRRSATGKNVPLTKIALVSGLDTRTVSNVRKQIQTSGHLYRERFLRDLTPESAVVEAWAKRVERASKAEKTKARKLSYGDEDSEFERLIRSTVKSRGITTQSIIERLVATQSATQNKENRTIELLVDKFSPYLSNDEQNRVNAALSAVSNLIATIDHNVQATGDERFFQRQLWTFRLQSDRLMQFRQHVRDFLENMESRARAMIEPWENESFEGDLTGTGIGMYYFEEKNDDVP